MFNEVRRDPEIGIHYYAIGPTLAYDSLEKFFALHGQETEFPPHFLARAFLALLLHDRMLARNCGVRENPTPEEIPALAETTVDFFLKAYFKTKVD